MQSEFKISNSISDCVSLYRVAFLYSFNVDYLRSNAKKERKKILNQKQRLLQCVSVYLFDLTLISVINFIYNEAQIFQ